MSPIRTVDTQASRVLIGAGARHLVPDELHRQGLRKFFLIATSSTRAVADEFVDVMRDQVVTTFDSPAVHTPVPVTEDAVARLSNAECIVTVGGGSAIGLSKAIASRTGIPQIVLPTTYSGSEVTPVLGETLHGSKSTRRDPALLPGTVIYDPELTTALPPRLTVMSGMNALAHAVEALWASDATPVSDAYARLSCETLLYNLPLVSHASRELSVRTRLQEAGWLAGLCLALTRMGPHHQLAHVLGGTYDLPHAELHTTLLPHVVRFLLPAAPAANSILALITGDDPCAAIRATADLCGETRTLRELGVPKEGLSATADRVLANPYPSPRPLEREWLLDLLEAAWSS
jgi:maleylacetate reductase